MIDPRDTALRRACPIVSMPRYGELPPLENGQRLVLGCNGLFLEVKSPWLRCCTRIAELPRRLPLGFGEVAERLSFTFGTIPLALLHEFIAIARDALPNEVAGALVYDCDSRALSLRMHRPIAASASSIRYRIAAMAAHELLAIDLHSHGRLDAFWSGTDDADDRGIRVCGVFGRVDRARPSARFRLALNGHFVELPCPWDDAASPATAPHCASG